MDIDKVRDKAENYQKALSRLNEAVNEPHPSEYVYDAVVKRFEFVYELSWRLMKAVVEYKGGSEPKFPRDVFREAFAGGIVRDGEVWLDMMKDRNLTSHTYDNEHAREAYERIKTVYIVHFQALLDHVKGEVQHAIRGE
ncbi:MAG: nucleotidyltransferase substrate binding protein [Anaerohalosphaeraceae bacterium]